MEGLRRHNYVKFVLISKSLLLPQFSSILFYARMNETLDSQTHPIFANLDSGGKVDGMKLTSIK